MSLRRSTVIAAVLAASSALLHATPGRALNAVCTASWTPPNVSPGGTASAPLAAGAPPCPSAAITASVTVGSGANAGTINTGDAITGSGTNNLTRTAASSVDIGVPASTSATENLTLVFSQAVPNPYLFFTYLDPGTSFTFSQAFTLFQANNASASGQTVTVASNAANSNNDGFIVRMQGTYSTINFGFTNTTGAVQSVAFTAGATYAPGPLPLMGAGVAFGFSRRLRRRLQGQG